MKLIKILRGTALAGSLCIATFAQAQTTPIQFDPDGPGPGGALTVATFDWAPNSAIALKGAPATGLAVGSKVLLLSHAKLGILLNAATTPIYLPPAGTEFTFVGGAGETVIDCDVIGPCRNATFVFDPTESTNFFEIWVKTTPPPSSTLEGTGFNQSKRILYGSISDAFGNFAEGTCPVNGAGGVLDNLDQFNSNDWGSQRTICGSGTTQISVQVISIDPDYFPGFTPTQVADLKLQFNTSTVVPYRQADPSRLFIGNGAGVTGNEAQVAVAPNLGNPNGFPDGTLRDFQFQADANHAFERGVEVPGACRVTYGGNDRNGNIAQNSFGEACMKVSGSGKGKANGVAENCYTFGGQVGAPTANPALGGPFGEHTHHNVSGPAGDFVFRAGTHSAPKTTRITATACKDPGACRPAEANAGFKQIDFEGTGSFRTLDSVAAAYLKANGAGTVLPDHQSDRKYYFRVDMDDTGEPGNKAAKGKFDVAAATNFLTADPNAPLSTPDPLLTEYAVCNQLADVYQFYICKDENACEQSDAIYAVRGYLTGGNIQLHKVIK